MTLRRIPREALGSSSKTFPPLEARPRDLLPRLLRLLQTLLPSARVGGCYLPELGQARLHEESGGSRNPGKTSRNAVADQTVSRLVGTLLDSRPTLIGHRPAGDRSWPAGVVGSVSDKHGILLAAVAPRTSYSVVGIDLESTLGSNLRQASLHFAPEGTPKDRDGERASVVTFAAKEASYKGYFSSTRNPIELKAIIVEWATYSRGRSQGFAQLPDGSRLAVSTRYLEHWVLAVATQSDTRAASDSNVR